MTLWPLWMLAIACARPDALPERGPHDPIAADGPHAGVTTGRMAGFLRLFVDPATFPDTLVPIEPTPPPPPPLPTPGPTLTLTPPLPTAPFAPPRGDLALANPEDTWVRVRVGDAEIGIVAPRTDAVIRDVRGGVYEVTFTLPNGFSRAERLTAAPALQSPATPP